MALCCRCVYAIALAVEVVVSFLAATSPHIVVKKEKKKNIKTKSTETCYSLLMYHIFRKKEKKEEEDIVQDGSLAFCWDH